MSTIAKMNRMTQDLASAWDDEYVDLTHEASALLNQSGYSELGEGVEIKIRAVVFGSCESEERVRVLDSGLVQAWDHIGRHWTNCHSMSAATMEQAAKKARAASELSEAIDRADARVAACL